MRFYISHEFLGLAHAAGLGTILGSSKALLLVTNISAYGSQKGKILTERQQQNEELGRASHPFYFSGDGRDHGLII